MGWFQPPVYCSVWAKFTCSPRAVRTSGSATRLNERSGVSVCEMEPALSWQPTRLGCRLDGCFDLSLEHLVAELRLLDHIEISAAIIEDEHRSAGNAQRLTLVD